MKVVNIREARGNLASLVGASQKESVYLTCHGKPVAMLTGLSSFFECSEALYKDLQSRRKARGRRYTLEEVRAKFEQRDKKERNGGKGLRRGGYG